MYFRVNRIIITGLNLCFILANSTSNVQDTHDELQTTGSAISQSGKLLAKYDRRESTDKVILFLAFVFFLFCVLYIIQKRLY